MPPAPAGRKQQRRLSLSGGASLPPPLTFQPPPSFLPSFRLLFFLSTLLLLHDGYSTHQACIREASGSDLRKERGRRGGAQSRGFLFGPLSGRQDSGGFAPPPPSASCPPPTYCSNTRRGRKGRFYIRADAILVVYSGMGAPAAHMYMRQSTSSSSFSPFGPSTLSSPSLSN